MSKDNQVLEELTSKEYEHGWTTNIETESAPKGLNEDIIRFISAKRMSRNGSSNGALKLITNGLK